MGKRSAGILLFSRQEGAVRVLLVHPGGPFWKNKDRGAWSIPKGEHADDEDAKAAALREFSEETGTRLDGEGPAGTGAVEDRLIDLGEIRQKSGKIVRAWALEGEFDVSTLTSNTVEIQWPPRSGRTMSFPEADRAQWCDRETAQEKIIPAQAEFLDRLDQVLDDA